MALPSTNPGLVVNADPDEDIGLMRRAQSGDADAFAYLYTRYLPGVTAFLVSRGGRSLSPDVLAQEVFLRAWMNRARFHGHSSVATYFMGIAANVLREAIQVRGRQAGSGNTLQDARQQSCPYCGDPCNLTPPEAAICRSEQDSALVREISVLPGGAKKALEAVLVNGLNIKDAAAASGCSTEACNKRIRRAVQLLRKRMRIFGRKRRGDAHSRDD